MEFLPHVRKKLVQRRMEKILDTASPVRSDPLLTIDCLELSIEGFIAAKIEHFFERLGTHDAQGLYDIVLAQVERPLIEKALSWAKGNQLKAARVLGVNRNTLRVKMKQLKIQNK